MGSSVSSLDLQVDEVEQGSIPGPAGDIPVRIFRPDGRARGLYLHLHGGGWNLVHPSHHRAQTGQRCCITAEVPALDEGEKRPCNSIPLSHQTPPIKFDRHRSRNAVIG